MPQAIDYYSEEEKKKKANQTVPAAPAAPTPPKILEGRITGLSGPPTVIKTLPETKPFQPQTTPGFGPSYPPEIRAAAENAYRSMLAKPFSANAAFGNRNFEQVISDVASRFGGMDKIRGSSMQTSRSTDMTDQSARPYVGSYMEGLLERGPSNRLENILLRRYYANVGQQSQSTHRGENVSQQETVGEAPVMDMLRDVLNAQNVAENIGLDAQAQALNAITQGEIQGAQNRTSAYNQLVQSGTSLLGTEMDAASRMFGQRTGTGTMKESPAWDMFSEMIRNQTIDVTKNGQIDYKKMGEEWIKFQNELPSAVSGGGTGVLSTLPKSGIQIPLQQGNAQMAQGLGAKLIPPDLDQMAVEQGLIYLGVARRGNKTSYVFRAPDGSIKYADR